MADPLKPTGEIVRGLAGNADLDLASVKQALFEALKDGSTDPSDYVQVIGEALLRIEAAHVAAGEIVRICERAAVRGPYKEAE